MLFGGGGGGEPMYNQIPEGEDGNIVYHPRPLGLIFMGAFHKLWLCLVSGHIFVITDFE